MKFYPEDAGQTLNETSQASQWLHEANPHHLTQMYRIGTRDYYIFEPAALGDGTICMPTRWFKRGDAMWFKAWLMVAETHEDRHGWVIDQTMELTLSEANLRLCGKELVNGAYLGPGKPGFECLHGEWFKMDSK